MDWHILRFRFRIFAFISKSLGLQFQVPFCMKPCAFYSSFEPLYYTFHNWPEILKTCQPVETRLKGLSSNRRYSGVFNNCAAHLINFSENSNLHTLIKDLHIYLFLRITPTCTFITACTIIDIAKFLAQNLIFSSKLNNIQLVLPYSTL